MSKELELLSNLIDINISLDNILTSDDSDIQETNFELIYYLLSNSNIYPAFINILNCQEYKIFMNGTTSEKLDIYKKIKEDLNSSLRYELLNYNIEQELEQLKKYNPFAYQNLSKIILLSIAYVLEYNQVEEKSDIPFPIEKTISVVKLYLTEIDKSNHLCELFEQKLTDGNILLWPASDEREELRMVKSHKELIFDTKGWKVFNEKDTLYLNAPYDGTILDIYRLIHEFIHLYIYSKKDNILEVTSTEVFFEEFPPIYYETMLKDFLIKIGFSKNIASAAIKERECAFINDVNSLITLGNLIKIKEKRPITKNDLISMYNLEALKDRVKNLSNEEAKKYYQEMLKCGIDLNSKEQTAKNICDNLNANIITFKYTEHKCINYIIAKLLTEHLNTKTPNNQQLQEKILYVTGILGTTENEPDKVLEILECDDLFDNLPSFVAPSEKNNIKSYKYQEKH